MTASDCDVAVIGAGAAGIGAARRLAELRLGAVVLEARDRVGGRAHTVTVRGDLPVDLGCEWLHSADRNPLTSIARDLGFTVDERLPDWGLLRRFGDGDAARAERIAASTAFYERLEAAAAAPVDRAAAQLLEPGCRWNAVFGAISTYANGIELEHVSVHDHARYDDSGINWRIREGYGSLFQRLAAGIDVRLGCAVDAIDHRDSPIIVSTRRGDLRARAVLVTLPTPLIAGAAIRFTPALPVAKVEAARGVPLGLANKLFLALEGRLGDVLDDGHVLGAVDRVATGSYHVRPYGRPLVSAYFGGALARELETLGPAGMTEFAVDQLVGLFGSGVRGRLSYLASSAWATDPQALGSYSYALPGHADDRAVLAAPVDDRLFFAGEACAPTRFSTAHGAFESGRAAAEAIERALTGRG